MIRSFSYSDREVRKREKQRRERQHKRLRQSECKLAEALEIEDGSSNLEGRPQVSRTVRRRRVKQARMKNLYIWEGCPRCPDVGTSLVGLKEYQ